VASNISWQQLVRKFRRLGFDGPYSGGRHLFMKKEQRKVHIPNLHRGDISAHLVTKILHRAGITPEDWNRA